MTNTDELDRLWRDTLRSGADSTLVGEAEPRVAARVRQRRRRRAAGTAAILLVVVCTTLGAAVLLTRHPSHVTVSHGLAAVVEVVDGPSLSLRFPGRATSDISPRIDLPSGLIRFEVRVIGSHRLVIDGVPGFVADGEYGGPSVTENVRLQPGDYLIHCTIPGHAEAGEEAIIHVQ